jgi:predicted ribosomally synthesized peptide with nif11-like leader
MSVEQARAFLGRVDEDEQVRNAAQAAYSAELLKLAKKLGFQVSDEDLKTAIAELSDVGDEVSLDQLENVVGGVARTVAFRAADSITRR